MQIDTRYKNCPLEDLAIPSPSKTNGVLKVTGRLWKRPQSGEFPQAHQQGPFTCPWQHVRVVIQIVMHLWELSLRRSPSFCLQSQDTGKHGQQTGTCSSLRGGKHWPERQKKGFQGSNSSNHTHYPGLARNSLSFLPT